MKNFAMVYDFDEVIREIENSFEEEIAEEVISTVCYGLDTYGVACFFFKHHDEGYCKIDKKTNCPFENCVIDPYFAEITLKFLKNNSYLRVTEHRNDDGILESLAVTANHFTYNKKCFENKSHIK